MYSSLSEYDIFVRNEDFLRYLEHVSRYLEKYLRHNEKMQKFPETYLGDFTWYLCPCDICLLVGWDRMLS